MRGLGRTSFCIRVVVPFILPAGLLWFPYSPSRAEENAGPDGVAALEQPSWQVGDSWVVETLTQRVQGREDKTAGREPRVRWEFRVAKIEKVADSDCFRLEVRCLAQGRIRPQSTLWCDQKTLFLRQFETQIAFNGQYRTVQESYSCAKGSTSPVMTFVNVLPVAMPAFLPGGAKGGETFSYVSQPIPPGAKDTGIIRFTHEMKQEQRAPGSKSLDQLPTASAEKLDAKSAVEVTLADSRRSLVQLWQKGAPWPIYADDGRTKAWLVSKESQ